MFTAASSWVRDWSQKVSLEWFKSRMSSMKSIQWSYSMDRYRSRLNHNLVVPLNSSADQRTSQGASPEVQNLIAVKNDSLQMMRNTIRDLLDEEERRRLEIVSEELELARLFQKPIDPMIDSIIESND